MIRRVMTLMAACSLVASLAAQDVDERIRALEEQNREILKRLEASESSRVELRDELDRLRTERNSEQLDSRLETVINDVALDEGGVTYKQLTKSGNAIQFYGFLRTDAYYNEARMNSVILPFFVLPENGTNVDSNNDAFAFDARLTRFGVNINAGHIGAADVMGKLETDFANFPAGVPESRETPRIRLAYIDIDFGDVALRFGQDWDIISPLLPSVNSETLLWNAGNPGDRRPMAQFHWTPPESGGVAFELKIALGLTGAVDNADLDGAGSPFSSTERDGFDSGHPHIQIRPGVTFNSWVEGKKATIGIFGAFGRMETDTQFNGEDEFDTYLAGLDITLPLFGGVTLRGEFFYGQALADFRGGIAQSINTAQGEEITSIGGWGELQWQVTDDWRLHGGGSIDDPDNDDLGTGARESNFTFYVGTVYSFGGGLRVGFDVIYWETTWIDIGLGNTVRFNGWIQLDF